RPVVETGLLRGGRIAPEKTPIVVERRAPGIVRRGLVRVIGGQPARIGRWAATCGRLGGHGEWQHQRHQGRCGAGITRRALVFLIKSHLYYKNTGWMNWWPGHGHARLII